MQEIFNLPMVLRKKSNISFKTCFWIILKFIIIFCCIHELYHIFSFFWDINIYWTCVKLVALKPINIFYEIDQLIYSPNTYMWHIPTATFSLTKTSANPLTPNCSMVLFNFYKVIKLFFNRTGEYLQNTCTSKKNIHAIFISLIFFSTGRFKLKLT